MMTCKRCEYTTQVCLECQPPLNLSPADLDALCEETDEIAGFAWAWNNFQPRPAS